MAKKTSERRTQPATGRMEAARRVKTEAITRELLWVAIASRLWPSRLERPRVPQASFPWLLTMTTPAGSIAYRLTEEEADLFAHVPRADRVSTVTTGDKTAILHALAVDGWPAQTTDAPR